MWSERMRALYRAQGSSAVHCAVEELLARSEQRTRELISAIPDGVYSFDDVLDDVGPGTEPVRVCVDVTIKGDEAVVDFSRSSDQVKAGINSYINYTRAYATFSIRTFAKVDVPHNDGVERPIRTVARSKSFFNPEYPAPSSGRANIQIRIFDAINGALAKALPERVMGAFSHWANPIFGGVHDETGRPWVMYDLIFGGYGGRFDKDGPEALCPVFNAANLPIEVHEANNPVLFHRRASSPIPAARENIGAAAVFARMLRSSAPAPRSRCSVIAIALPPMACSAVSRGGQGRRFLFATAKRQRSARKSAASSTATT
jgi:N-methylhydantoinase B